MQVIKKVKCYIAVAAQLLHLLHAIGGTEKEQRIV